MLRQNIIRSRRTHCGNFAFPANRAQGLLLSPALGFVLQEIWDYNEDHHGFWQAVSHSVNDSDGDPIIRSATGRIAAILLHKRHALAR